MNQVLVICGPTATGKTALALQLAREFSGDLISADSRQVYRGLDIVTGKDIPSGFSKNEIYLAGWGSTTIYSDGKITIWGLDAVEHEGKWSAGEFQKFASKAIGHIRANKRLPILVGGTGLYLKAVTEALPLPGNPPDERFRHKLEKLPLVELQNKLKLVDPVKFAQFNNSDLNNPRRLIRALEVNLYGRPNPSDQEPLPVVSKDTLVVCLTAPKEDLEERIRRRVEARLEKSLDEEMKIWRAMRKNLPAKSSLGYAELEEHQTGKITQAELLEKWTIRERQYAKRQLTWFKKQRGIRWFDITAQDWQNEVVAMVRSWYSVANGHQTQTTQD